MVATLENRCHHATDTHLKTKAAISSGADMPVRSLAKLYSSRRSDSTNNDSSARTMKLQRSLSVCSAASTVALPDAATEDDDDPEEDEDNDEEVEEETDDEAEDGGDENDSESGGCDAAAATTTITITTGRSRSATYCRALGYEITSMEYQRRRAQSHAMRLNIGNMTTAAPATRIPAPVPAASATTSAIASAARRLSTVTAATRIPVPLAATRTRTTAAGRRSRATVAHRRPVEALPGSSTASSSASASCRPHQKAQVHCR